VYPKKVGKGAAEKAWGKIRPDKATFDRIISSVQAHRRCEQWRKDNGQYIPNPATWLNQKRWEDEVGAAAVGETIGRSYALGDIQSMVDVDSGGRA
jgi:hypothetical protein